MNYYEIINEIINDLQGVLNENIPDIDRNTVDDIKADAHEALCNIFKKHKLIEL
ncbi:hypothetical protein SDC9_204885 [bioreactor metagenome]|uniref:Uncharacterized protein n=1 Tax=bioreactor metagenome TaxID=1076179 RepID=A0A645J0S8_9ZZZZ